MDTASLKKALRKTLLASRMAIAPAEAIEKSQQIFDRWREHFALQQTAYLHLFLSMPQQREVATTPFVEHLRHKHPRIRIVVPKVEKGNPHLNHILYTTTTVLRESPWGVPEPVAPAPHVSPMLLDMVLVPMLGFDPAGNRLGYGMGYYDRFLALTRPKCRKIGLCFETGFMEDGLPVTPHDVRLDYVVTENQVYRFSPNPQG